jgi:protein-S-isoprenylcysteine O-methyltransferase Ste14
VNRFAVTTIFAAMTAATAVNVFGVGRDALASPETKTWALAAYAILRLAVVAAFSVFVFLRSPARRSSRDPIALIACAAAVGGVVVLQQPAATASTPLVVLGDVLALVSCVWLLVSVLALGRCFGVLPEVRGLVTRGPYRLVRHPVYLGELGACTGLVLAAPTPWNLCVAAFFAAAQAVRMRLEEVALLDEFPEYADYSSATPSLVPGLQGIARLRAPRSRADWNVLRAGRARTTELRERSS